MKKVSSDIVEIFLPVFGTHNTINALADFEKKINSEPYKFQNQAAVDIGFMWFCQGMMNLMNPLSTFNTRYNQGGTDGNDGQTEERSEANADEGTDAKDEPQGS
jgi:hypothetical protein